MSSSAQESSGTKDLLSASLSPPFFICSPDPYLFLGCPSKGGKTRIPTHYGWAGHLGGQSILGNLKGCALCSWPAASPPHPLSHPLCRANRPALSARPPSAVPIAITFPPPELHFCPNHHTLTSDPAIKPGSDATYSLKKEKKKTRNLQSAKNTLHSRNTFIFLSHLFLR